MKIKMVIGIATAAAVGLLLAWLLFAFATPETGGDLPERPSKLAQLQPGDIPRPEGEDWHPEQIAAKAKAAREAAGDMGEGADMPNPVSAGIEEARHTPEVRAVAMRTASWTQVRRLLHADQSASNEELAVAISQLTRDMFDGRREPWKMDYQDLSRREEELMKRVRDAAPNDPEVARALARIDEVRGQYASGTLPE